MQKTRTFAATHTISKHEQIIILWVETISVAKCSLRRCAKSPYDEYNTVYESRVECFIKATDEHEQNLTALVRRETFGASFVVLCMYPPATITTIQLYAQDVGIKTKKM